MSQCFVCDSHLGVTHRQTYNIFLDHASTDKTLAHVLNDILDKIIPKSNLYSHVICKKCNKNCVEYEQIKKRLHEMKTDVLTQFKATLSAHDLEYSTCFEPPSPQTVAKGQPAKRLVLPASKLKPLPANYVFNMGNVPSALGYNANVPKTVSATSAPSTLSLKVTVGSSVLTQSLTTSTIKTVKKPSTTMETSPYKMPQIILSTGADTSTSNAMSFKVGSLPKNFLASSTTEAKDKRKVMKSEDDEDNNDENDEQTMEIDEDCTVIRVGDDCDAIPIQFTDASKDNSNDATDDYYIDPALDSDDGGEELELREVLLSDEHGDDGETIVMADEGGSVLRVVGGRRLVYSGGKLALDQGNDSNDESQFELQVSGDEETANAIIAAAQERGGAFIKVESGEMFRVKSVKSKTDEDTKFSETQPIVGKQGKLFKCLLCDNNTNDPLATECVGDARSVAAHMRSEHDARVYLCQLCGTIMRRKSDYIAHTKEHAAKCKEAASPGDKSPKPHLCTVCKKSFGSRTLLSEHMNLHSGRRPYTCATCHKTFASKYTYQAHLKTHQDRPRPFKCASCPKSFLSRQNLTQHLRTHSGVKEFECNVCGKAFGTQHNLEVHGVVHSGARPFKCTECPKSFARRAEQRDHARTHTGERPFACDICGATFSQRSNLHSHKRATHFDDKRHQCTRCPKRFKRRRLLDYHITSAHTGERPFRCKVCQATFVYPEHFKKHQRIHSGERPHVCEVCGKSFNSRDNRNTHRFVHSDKKPYECLVCGAGYMRKQLLYAHMNTSGHIAESIVVNQPRVQQIKQVKEKVTPKPKPDPPPIVALRPKPDKLKAIFEASQETDNATVSMSTDGPKLFITNDKKMILHDSTSAISLVQDMEDPTLLTMQNIDAKDARVLMQAVDADQTAADQPQFATGADGALVRLVQIQLDDGTSGWVALGDDL